MTVEIDLPNKDRALKGGMFARVEALVGTHQQAVQIRSTRSAGWKTCSMSTSCGTAKPNA